MQFFLLSVSQPPERGGGSSRLGQNPKFVKGNKLGAPLSICVASATLTARLRLEKRMERIALGDSYRNDFISF